MSIQKQIFVLMVLVVITLALVFLRPAEEPVLRALAPSPVLVSAVARQDLRPEEVVSGHLRPSRRAWLRFEVEGRVAGRLVEAGQFVESGAVLLTLEAQDYEDILIQAQADLQQAKANLDRDRTMMELAQRSRKLQEEEVSRLESLGERSLASKTRLGDSQALLAQRLSEEAQLRSSVSTGPQRVAAREAAVSRAQRDLERTALKSPFAGRVNQVKVEIGDFAGRNQPALELVDEQIDFYTQVRGPVARALQLGQQVQVEVAGQVYTASVLAIQPDPDPATFTHAVRLRMPESENRAGAAASARLLLASLQDVLVIPATALLREEGHAFVFRVEGDRLRRVAVDPGPRVGSKQVIRAGLAAGQQVVVRDVAALADDQLVIVEALRTAE